MDAYMEGNLSQAEKARFEGWLAAYPDLQTEFAWMQEMRGAMEALPLLTCPDHVVKTTFKEVDRDLWKAWKSRIWVHVTAPFKPAYRPAWALATVTALCIIGFVLMQKHPQPVTPSVATKAQRQTPIPQPQQPSAKSGEAMASLPSTPQQVVNKPSTRNDKPFSRGNKPKRKPKPNYSPEEMDMAADQTKWVLAFLGDVAEKTERIQAHYIEEHVAEPVRQAAAAPFEVLRD